VTCLFGPRGASSPPLALSPTLAPVSGHHGELSGKVMAEGGRSSDPLQDNFVFGSENAGVDAATPGSSSAPRVGLPRPPHAAGVPGTTGNTTAAGAQAAATAGHGVVLAGQRGRKGATTKIDEHVLFLPINFQYEHHVDFKNCG
jgi:hypothetical protein